jgi:hypothetical protein
MTMKMTLVKKPSGSPQADYERFRGSVIKGILDGPIKSAVESFEETYSTWVLIEDQPVFNPETVGEQGKIVFQIIMEAPSAEQATLSVWQLLERGTDIRPMQVSSDWLSKTEPGSVVSNAGAGHTIGIFQPWADGIEARGWIELVGDLIEPEANLEVFLSSQSALDKIIGS